MLQLVAQSSLSATSAPGLCAAVCKGEEGNCSSGDLGTYRPVTEYGIRSLADCHAACRRCPRCRFVSWSVRRKECAWFRSCDINAMRIADGSYISESSVGRNFESFSTQPLRRRTTTPLPLLPFAQIERVLSTREGSAGVGAMHTPSRAANFGDPAIALTETQLERAVHHISRRGRLPCLVHKASRQPVTVAALGGSVTSGLPFGTFTGDDHARSHWLYHRKLAHWMAAQWPRTQKEALNTSFNCGLPAVGPAFTTLCLHSLLPPAPDLVLVEYAINLQGEDDHQWFELLLRKLLSSSPDLAIVAVLSFRITSASEVCVNDMRLCDTYGGGVMRGPSPAERAIQAVCKHYGVPLVSLRHALGDDLGTLPYVLSNFAKDCAHPTPQGHSWLAQLVVHAIRRAAAALAASDAPLADERCGRGRLTRELPAPRLLSPRTAALGGNTSLCLHGESLAAAMVGATAFAIEGGRKPGLKAVRAGSVVRLRVSIPAGMSGTWAHVGYLQSWRRDMGRAALTCEAPCRCGTTDRSALVNAPPLWLEGWSANEKVSVTKILPFYVRRDARAATPGGSCIARIQVHAGSAGGGRFVVSDFISGSSDPGPLTWAFDVAGSLLLHEQSQL